MSFSNAFRCMLFLAMPCAVLGAQNQGTPVPAAAPLDAALIEPTLRADSARIATLDGVQGAKLAEAIDLLARRAFFGPERFPGMQQLGLVLHKVEKGENPTTIAARYHVGPKLLERLNEGFDEKRLRVGQQLKVLDLSRGGLEVRVHKSIYRLSVWNTLPSGERVLVMFVPIGIGAEDSPTPSGTTKIVKRVLDPQWTDPTTRKVFEPKDPGNVLGGYWIALDSAGIGKSGIGLHGYTGAPSSRWIEQPGSHGCVRLLQSDIECLFHLAVEGTPVVISE